MSDESQKITSHISPFDAIRRIDENNNEYWSARDLYKVLGYDDYRNFLKVVAKAKIACQQSQQAVADHFVDTNEMVGIGSKAKRKVSDIHSEAANQVHFDIGHRVRNMIIETGATLPEDLPTPEKSIQHLQREEQQRIAQQQQPPLFPLEGTSE